jgi:hypothetical protein
MLFNYDPASHRADLQAQGYAHLKQVLSEEFVAQLRGFYADAMAQAKSESADWAVKGKKRQFVYDFPSTEAAEEFRAGMAALTGIRAESLTISERHLKVYDEAANPWPAPHKDRSASHYSIGLPVDLPEGSTVCVFPELEPGDNTSDRAIFLGGGTLEDTSEIYARPDAKFLNEKVGDVVLFLGSALYHERVRGAGTAILYIKVNGAGVDPLGENIFAAEPVPAE